MGHKRDGLLLFGEWNVSEAAVGKWVKPSTVQTCILAPVAKAGWLQRATHVQVDDAAAQPIGSVKKLEQQAAKWRSELAVIYAGARDDADFRLRISLSKAGARLSVAVGDGFLDGTTRAKLQAIALAWAANLSEQRCHLMVAHVAPVDAPYPRPFPPRDSARWPLGALDYFLGREWHGFDEETQHVLDKLTKAKLPKGGSRETIGDVVAISFAADPTDAKAVAKARVISHEWAAKLVPTEIENGWNELGDREIVPSERTKLAPFTFYDADEHVGYKGLAIDPDSGEVDADAWDELVAIIKAGKHKGKEVAGVRLVLPVRAAALKLHARAMKAGFEMVTYPKDSSFWQVHPALDDE